VKNAVWRAGHEFTLLENGEGYYPDLYRAIDAAKKEVLLETFILFDDPVGQALKQHLSSAARRGCKVEITVDGYGSHDLPKEYIEELTEAGVKLHVYDPQPTLMGIRTNLFRRLHRKLVVIDRKVAFIGGINYSIDHLEEAGPESKQDYALRVSGAVVNDIRDLMVNFISEHGVPKKRSLLRQWRDRWFGSSVTDPEVARGPGLAAFVFRDNDAHRNDIELAYRAMIRSARSEIIIANAYFLPGLRLLRDLRQASRRGVDVHLVLQGNGDWALLEPMTQSLYDYLIRAGIVIHEYCRRPMHGKVAVADGRVCTVGSSNLDPLSLFLNLEANLFANDEKLSAELRDSLMRLIEKDCKTVNVERDSWLEPIRRMRSFAMFHLLRRFPYWSGWLPGHAAQLKVARAGS
jgi:cardiolipin synthase A/B